MLREVVESRLIRSVGYSTAERLLEIEFVSGRIYLFSEVALPTYRALRHADSPGAYFNEHIRDRFRFTEVDP